MCKQKMWQVKWSGESTNYDLNATPLCAQWLFKLQVNNERIKRYK